LPCAALALKKTDVVHPPGSAGVKRALFENDPEVEMAEDEETPAELPEVPAVLTMPENAVCSRYFVSYTGIKLPVRMVNPLEEKDLSNRNTFIIAYFDKDERIIGFEKMVYAAIELSHYYDYHPSGILKSAEIMMDDVTTFIEYDEAGNMVSAEA